MKIYKRLSQPVAWFVWAVTICLSLTVVGCSDSDRNKAEPVSDTAILQVLLGLDEAVTKGYDVPSSTYMAGLVLYDNQGQQISKMAKYTADGVSGTLQWQKPKANEILLQMEIPEDIVSSVDRLEVGLADENLDMLGYLTEGGITCSEGVTTRVDFTAADAPAFVPNEEMYKHFTYSCTTDPELVEGTVTAKVGDQIYVYVTEKYTDEQGYTFNYELPDHAIVLRHDSSALTTEQNVITCNQVSEGELVTVYPYDDPTFALPIQVVIQ